MTTIHLPFLKFNILLLLFASCVSVKADTVRNVLSYKHLGEEDGLFSKAVYSIIQDTEGFIWFGTDAGAFRYDGKFFRRLSVDDGLTDNEILKIYQDKKGRIWFLTLNGRLCFWKNGMVFNSSNTPFLKNAHMDAMANKMFEEESGRLWIGYKMSGVMMIDDTVIKKFQVIGSDRDWATDNIIQDKQGKIWYFYKDKMVDLFSNDTVSLPENVTNVSQLEEKGSAYLTFSKGLYKIKDGQLTKKIAISDYPELNKMCNLVTYKNELWVCTLGDGCLHFRDDKLVNRYLPNSSVTSVFTDKEGNLWFSTISDGVYLLTKNNDFIRNYNKESGLSGSKIMSIAVDENNAVWSGNINGIVDEIKQQ